MSQTYIGNVDASRFRVVSCSVREGSRKCCTVIGDLCLVDALMVSHEKSEISCRGGVGGTCVTGKQNLTNLPPLQHSRSWPTC